MAQRRNIRKILDENLEEEGCLNRASEQPPEGVYDKIGPMHHHDRTSYFRRSYVYGQRPNTSSTTVTTYVSTDNTVWTSPRRSVSATTFSIHTSHAIPEYA